MPATEPNVPGSRCVSASFAVVSSSSVIGRLPSMPRSSFMNSMSATSLFAVTMSPPARNAPGPLPKREARVDAVAVALFLADVGVQPRLELPAEDRVHHLQRVVVRRVARRTGIADGERRLRGARLVDEIDRRRPRLAGSAGYVNAGLSPPAAHFASARSTSAFAAGALTSPTTVTSARPGWKYALWNATMSSRVIALTDSSVTACPNGCAPP